MIAAKLFDQDMICGAIALLLGFLLIALACREFDLFGPKRDLPAAVPTRSTCGNARKADASARKAGSTAEDDEAIVPVPDTNALEKMGVNDDWLFDDDNCKQQAPLQNESELRQSFEIDGTNGSTWVAGEEETERFSKYSLDKDTIRRSVNVRTYGVSRESPRYTSTIGASTSVAHQLYGSNTATRSNLSQDGICFGGNDQHWDAVKLQNGNVAVNSCGDDM